MSIVILRNQMSQDLRAAMKSRDKVAVSLLRTLMATIDNAEAVAVDLSIDIKIKIFRRFVSVE